jgi:hypothetical protein
MGMSHCDGTFFEGRRQGYSGWLRDRLYKVRIGDNEALDARILLIETCGITRLDEALFAVGAVLSCLDLIAL